MVMGIVYFIMNEGAYDYPGQTEWLSDTFDFEDIEQRCSICMKD